MNSQKQFSASDLQKLLDKAINIDGLISFFDSTPSKDIIPLKKLKKITHETMENHSNEIYNYASPRGYNPLRQIIAKVLMKNTKLWHKILITSGAQQGIYLILKMLDEKNKGNKLRVASEDTSYIGFRHVVELLKGKYFTIPFKKGKLDTSSFQLLIKKKKINVIYLNPDYHNPTGKNMSTLDKKIIIKIAKKNNIFIVEDLCYQWLGLNNSQKLPAPFFKQYKKTLVVSSFSKIIAPGFRIGWIFSHDEKIIEKLTIKKRAIELFQPYLMQIVLYKFIKNNYKHYHKKIKKLYHLRKNFMEKCLKHYLDSSFSWETPLGGFYFWIKSPINTYKFMEIALKYKILFGPGRAFSQSKEKDRFFRLSFSNLSFYQINEGLKRLAKAFNYFSTTKNINKQSLSKLSIYKNNWLLSKSHLKYQLTKLLS